MAKKSRDELWIDKLLKNYDRRKALTDRDGDYVECCELDCEKPFTFLVLDLARHNGDSYPYCDEHYLQYRKTASKEQLDAIRKDLL